jgi:hypothetical protein
MGFSNAVEKKVREKVLFQGVGEVEVVSINPTKQEIETLIGTEIQNEPQYITTREDGSKSTRIDFWVKPQGYETLSKVTFWLEHTEKQSQSGKFQFINNQLRETWADSIEQVREKLSGDMGSWFKDDGLRKAFAGEYDLYNFLIKLGNIDIENSSVQFDNIKAIMEGDMTEIKGIVAKFNENNGNTPKTIKVLFGIDNDGRQVIYTKEFANAKQKTYKRLVDAAMDQYSTFKGEWGNNTEFRIYDEHKVPAQTETESARAPF